MFKNDEQSLLDEVMQAFTDIYSETEPTPLSEDNSLIKSSSSFSHLLSKFPIKKSNETSCRFTRELEERSRYGL
jgi:hypothetical protein